MGKSLEEMIGSESSDIQAKIDIRFSELVAAADSLLEKQKLFANSGSPEGCTCSSVLSRGQRRP